MPSCQRPMAGLQAASGAPTSAPDTWGNRRGCRMCWFRRRRKAGRAAICGRWCMPSRRSLRTTWRRRWLGSAGPSWRATREVYRTAWDSGKHSPVFKTTGSTSTDQPDSNERSKQGCSTTEAAGPSCALFCLHADAALSERDAAFLCTIAAYANRPSPKQLEWLRQIVKRVFAAS
jgi:hypothetical protein